MKLTKTSGASIAMTAAALIVSGAALVATANAETFKGPLFRRKWLRRQGRLQDRRQ